MNVFSRIGGALQRRAPRAATQSAGGGTIINTPDKLQVAMLGEPGAAGVIVTPGTALKVAAVFACVRIIADAVANVPLHIKERVDKNTREDADDHPAWDLLRVRPNRWQTPSQFKRMQQSQLLLRGEAFAIKIYRRGELTDIVPVHPDRVTVNQTNELDLEYLVRTKSGATVPFSQKEMFHLVGLSLDGVNGVSPIRYAAETIGLSIAQERHGAATFRNGAKYQNIFTHPGEVSPEARKNLRESLAEYRQGGPEEAGDLLLEEGVDVKQVSMTASDAQWIESRKVTRSDICMFFGIPPHMIGDTEKSTSWGSGIEQQSIGFVAYTLETWLTIWEETIKRDLIGLEDRGIYARFNRAALIRADHKSQMEAITKGMQWGVYNPDEARAFLDLNPRADGKGDKYYEPPNTAGGQNDGTEDPAK